MLKDITYSSNSILQRTKMNTVSAIITLRPVRFDVRYETRDHNTSYHLAYYPLPRQDANC